MAQVQDTIHSQLELLSPEYKGKPKGYRLPLPRVKLASSNVSAGPISKESGPVSVLEALVQARISTVEVPRSYPDKSLPWVVASAVMNVEIEGKQAVPIVIPGSSIKPPRGTLAHASELDLHRLHASESGRPVIIIVDMPPESRSRSNYLAEQLSEYPEARFLIVNTNELNISDESELVLRTGAQKMAVCDVSFSEMTDFFQRAFAFEDQQAGVIALKLSEMFSKFNLTAHPSYFAGVSTESLYSLLKANRRSELIQLAVAGFLSFIVANDRNDVNLSRTAREAFLRTLAFDIKVKKKSFDRAGLVAYVQEFADRQDFDLDPIGFIESFQAKGILHFDRNNKAVITLPFIESYLLASELRERPIEAHKYFDLRDEFLDQNTFDIYAELGPSQEIVQDVISELNKIEQEYNYGKKSNILLTDQIHPVALDYPRRLSELEKRFKKALQDVVANRSNKVEKQAVLDVASRVEEGVRTARENSKKAISDEEEAALKKLAEPFRIWRTAVILLGSSAERLDKNQKRALASAIAAVSAVLLDELMRVFPQGMITRFREDLSSDQSIKSLLNLKQDVEISPRVKELVHAVIDAYELSFFSFPFRLTMSHLCNAAGQPVLGTSVSNISVSDEMASLIAKLWAAEINAKRYKDDLIRAINALPPVPFLRDLLYSHLMARVFWNQWEIENRMALLDAADQSLVPLKGRKIDKGRVQRAIGKPKAKLTPKK